MTESLTKKSNISVCKSRDIRQMIKEQLISQQNVAYDPRGHSITKHTGGLALRSESKTPKYLSKNSNI